MERTFFFAIEIIHSGGGLGLASSPKFFLRTAGFGRAANLVILDYDYSQQKWNEYRKEMTSIEAEEIIERLKRLGIPERLPEVEGQPDTSDYCSELSLKIKVNDKRFYLDIMMQASGFRGKDAENLRGLLLYLFSIAGFQGSPSLT